MKATKGQQVGKDWQKEARAALKAGFAGKKRWLVGVSGGGDSVALLKLLVAEGYGKRIVVGHYNHKWSKWGDEAEAFVVALCKKLKVELVVGQGQGKPKTNAEAKARLGRREWLMGEVAARGLQGVMMAHTRTDMMESLLMRLGKGSGVAGLAGMGFRPMYGVPGKCIWRPLLGVGREQLRAYLKTLRQPWLDDPHDAAGENQRARVRKLLPALAQAGIEEEAVAASIGALSRANKALNATANDFWSEHVQRGLARLAVDRAALLAAPEEVALRVLERVLWLGDAEEDGKMVPRTGKRLALLERVRGHDKGVATLGGVKFIWDKASLRAEEE
ncbi:MAG: tRNA lysidine(34) synthetase TilS [Proteobacteria bacterium]|nr:tRNA lysidine(34) synthetase TilS [Pseudomonadota bacterium]